MSPQGLLRLLLFLQGTTTPPLHHSVAIPGVLYFTEYHACSWLQCCIWVPAFCGGFCTPVASQLEHQACAQEQTVLAMQHHHHSISLQSVSQSCTALLWEKKRQGKDGSTSICTQDTVGDLLGNMAGAGMRTERMQVDRRRQRIMQTRGTRGLGEGPQAAAAMSAGPSASSAQHRCQHCSSALYTQLHILDADAGAAAVPRCMFAVMHPSVFSPPDSALWPVCTLFTISVACQYLSNSG